MKKVCGRERRSRLSELPTELLPNIFCRLPGKTVVQFRTVCKTWYEILTDSRFISMHASCCANNQYGYLACLPRCRIERLDEWFHFLEYLKFPITNSYEFEVIGSCNGLLCLAKKSNCLRDHFPCTYLWNPFIRAYKKLPEFFFPQHLGYDSCISGFGFDSQTDDYKVFHMVRKKLSEKQKLWRKSVSDFVILNGLYSLKTDSWKVIQGDDYGYDWSSYPSTYHGCRIYFDGAFYWIPERRFTGSKIFIMWFDFCHEKIWTAKLPIDCCDDDREKKFIFMSQLFMPRLGNKLALFISEPQTVSESGVCRFNVWLMKKKKLSSNLTWDGPFSVLLSADKFEPDNGSFTYSESMFSEESWTRYDEKNSMNSSLFSLF